MKEAGEKGKKNMERGQRKQLTFGDASIGFPSK